MTKNSEMEAKVAILDKCCQKVDCLARGEVFDLVGTLDLPQSSSPVTARDALVKEISAAMSAGKDSGGYETLFDMLAHIALNVVEARGFAQTPVGTGCPPSLPKGWTQEHAAKAAWMINTLMVTPPDEWRTKTEIRHELTAEFGALSDTSTLGNSK